MTQTAFLHKVHAAIDLRQAMAAARLRQWAKARQQLRAGHRPMLLLRGRATHTNRTATGDAAIVAVVDFERALAKLTPAEQSLLVLRYRDGQPQRLVAIGLGVSIRTVQYSEGIALSKLADALEMEEFL